MKQYQTVLFDLDGTLTDSALGITNSIMFALEKFGIRVEDRAELYKFIGPPLIDSFKKYFHFDEEQTNRAVAGYHEYFADRGVWENSLYAGVRRMIQGLKNDGKTLAIASAKPQVFVKQILRRFNLIDEFNFVGGADLTGTRSRKEDVVRYVLKQLEITNLSETVLVGDREDDVLGARKNQIDSIGVLYGFGSRDELTTAGANYLVETVDELFETLRSPLNSVQNDISE